MKPRTPARTIREVALHLESLIANKRHDICEMEQQLRDHEVYLQALRDILAAQDEGTNACKQP